MVQPDAPAVLAYDVPACILSRARSASVFEQYSKRSRRVIFGARVKAGEYGAPAIDLDHLVEALVLEDEGKLADARAHDIRNQLRRPGRFSTPSPFFSSESASQILLKIHQERRGGGPVPDSVDLPTTQKL